MITKLCHHIDNVQVHGISGMDKSELLMGRPYGGCVIMIRDSLKCKFVPISVNERCYGGLLELSGLNILILSVYMPCDTSYDHNNLDIYNDVLHCIIDVCNNHTHIDHIVLAGDLNTDLTRGNSLHTRELLQFAARNNLCFGVHCECANIQYTFENINVGTFSTLDHFLFSENIMPCVTEYRSIHDGDNLSDHSPVLIRLALGVDHIAGSNARTFVPRSSWTKASEQNISSYRHELDTLMDAIALPMDLIQCQDMHCISHRDTIEKYYGDLISACILATDRCIPKTKRRGLAGWNDSVRSKRDVSIFWHHNWTECGRPHQGVVATIRRSTRTLYKRAVKELKFQQSRLRAEKMANSLLVHNHRDL